MTKVPVFLVLFVVTVASAQMDAPRPGQVGRPGSLVTSWGSSSPAAMTMVTSRARALGGEASGSGTKYVAVTSRDLNGLTPAQILERLAPRVEAGEGVKRVAIVVRLDRPLLLKVREDQPARIGTAVVDSRVKDIRVDAVVEVRKVTVISVGRLGKQEGK